jgi:hypothetical protein
MHLSCAGEAVWRPAFQALPRQSSTGADAAATVLPEAATQPRPVGAVAGPDYVWCGQTRALVPSLSPGQVTSVALQVRTCALSPLKDASSIWLPSSILLKCVLRI